MAQAAKLGSSGENFARAFRKGGGLFGITINIVTATMEDIYEGLCWIYITVKNAIVYGHVVIPITSQT